MAARDKERYFWLKLHKDFFKRYDVHLLEKLPGGRELVLLYLKLLTESVDRDGALRFSDELPYTEEMLAAVTDTETAFMHTALETLQQLRLLEVREDGTLFFPAVGNMVGSETFSGRRQRKYRENACAGDNVARLSPDCHPEKETEKESDTETDTESESESELYPETDTEKEKESEKEILTAPGGAVCRTEDVRRVMMKWNSLGLQNISRISAKSKRGKMLMARIGEYGLDAVLEAMERIRESSFLKGQNPRGWMITFDWFVKPNNFPKVLEGNYEPYTTAQPVTKNGFLELMLEDQP